MADQQNAPDYKLFELDKIATNELNDAGCHIKGNRVDVEGLILGKHKLQIEAFVDLRRKWDTYGFLNVDGDRIYVDADLMDDEYEEKKYRFTLAEELAHYLIHRNVLSKCKSVEERVRFERSLGDDVMDRMDRQAKALASAILMPKFLFEPLVESLAEKCRDDSAQIMVDELAKELSREFDVNYRAVKRRMKNLGYHKEERLGLNLD